MKVLIESYSRFYDVQTRIQFDPVLDQRTGCYVGVSDVDAERLEEFADRPSFTILTDAQWDEINTPPAVPESEPAASATGDPLHDADALKPPPAPPGEVSSVPIVAPKQPAPTGPKVPEEKAPAPKASDMPPVPANAG